MTGPMTKTLTALALLAVLPAGALLADDDDCTAARDQWQPMEAAEQMAKDQGWTVRRIKVDDGCYEIDGTDAQGRRIEAKLDPESLALVEMERKGGSSAHDDDHDNDDDGFGYGGGATPAPAGTIAPPQNGLFGDGAAPSVKVN
ncbi:PepSY domain-containing protein [Tropicibacter naphthalenivorans]|uniref:PepSY domain-containing protein n=1 Tax=Tropicibacter naphthalenivorans TaxID=441103 RepID=A0A0P1GFT0_9RHOB|nr:PepSY domain-containing protein [Tropicibacter naphthalenivorans]CUH80572.1 hypothetical protein TRN7648_03034 [Tropicibacter naphthalenivorans]SMC88058.1 hypothetical protein SAMN04488093_1065 [Tropicibacter naphthalenivorans]